MRMAGSLERKYAQIQQLKFSAKERVLGISRGFVDTSKKFIWNDLNVINVNFCCTFPNYTDISYNWLDKHFVNQNSVFGFENRVSVTNRTQKLDDRGGFYFSFLDALFLVEKLMQFSPKVFYGVS